MKYIKLYETYYQSKNFEHNCNFIVTDEYTEFTINKVENHIMGITPMVNGELHTSDVEVNLLKALKELLLGKMVSYVCDISGYPDGGKRKGIVRAIDTGTVVNNQDEDEIVVFIWLESDGEKMPTADKAESIRIWRKESDAAKFGI